MYNALSKLVDEAFYTGQLFDMTRIEEKSPLGWAGRK
jgi:hypothetical protein